MKHMTNNRSRVRDIFACRNLISLPQLACV